MEKEDGGKLNVKRLSKIVLSLSVVACIVLVSFALMYMQQSLRPFLIVVIFSVAGFVVGKANLKQGEDFRSCVIENSLIICVLMFSSRIGTFIGTGDVMFSFNPVDLVLSFIAYFGISNIVSLVLYFINDEPIKI